MRDQMEIHRCARAKPSRSISYLQTWSNWTRWRMYIPMELGWCRTCRRDLYSYWIKLAHRREYTVCSRYTMSQTISTFFAISFSVNFWRFFSKSINEISRNTYIQFHLISFSKFFSQCIRWKIPDHYLISKYNKLILKILRNFQQTEKNLARD